MTVSAFYCMPGAVPHVAFRSFMSYCHHYIVGLINANVFSQCFLSLFGISVRKNLSFDIRVLALVWNDQVIFSWSTLSL